MSPEERENHCVAEFIRPENPEICGLTLRPFSAGSLGLLRQINNELLFPSGEEITEDPETGAKVRSRVPKNPEMAALEFIYVQGAPLEEVRRSAFLDPALFREKVLAFADDITIVQLQELQGQVRKIILAANPAQVAIKPKKSDSSADQETPPPNS